jgi:two-component system, OmpR family, response regulator
VLRRAGECSRASAEAVAAKTQGRIKSCGPLRMDLDRMRIFWNGTEVVLTVTEFGLLRSLLEFPGKVYTRDELMNGAYAYDNIVTDRTIDSHIRRIRKKLADAGGDPIETVHGAGYRIRDLNNREQLS